MKQWSVNYLILISRLSCVLSLLWLVSGCNVPSPSIPAGWRIDRLIEHVIPQQQIALATFNNTAALAWAGAPELPNLQVALEEKVPLQLALGITPLQLSMLPLANHWLQLLWLDQTMPGDMQLKGGTVDAAGELQRGPTEISNVTTMEYAAVPTPAGTTVVLWNTPTRTGTELYLQVIDSVGRPLPAQRITANGRFPALAYDLRGNLHVVWAQSSDGKQWTIHHSALMAGVDLANAAVSDLASSVIGAIALAATQSIESIHVAADAETLYVIWSVATVGGSAEVQGVRSPLAQPDRITPFALTLAGYQVRWPNVAATPATAQYVGVIATDATGQSVPVMGKLAASGEIALQKMMDAATIVSRPAVGIDDVGNLHLAWLRLERDGRSSLVYMTNAP